MTEKIQAFCDEVCSYVNHATPDEKKEIAQELQDHLEDHTQALMELGRAEEEARRAALDAMGSAKEIGQELNKEYPLLWLVLSRIPAFITGILVIFLLISPFYLSFYHGYHNLKARFAAAESFEMSRNGHELENFIDIRMEIPPANDVVRFYAADVVREDGKYYAQIASCCYDKWVFGMASNNIHGNVKYLSIDERVPYASGGSGFSNYGVSYQLSEVEVAYGQESVRAIYDRFGTSWEVDIPLDWEGII